jgi:hypothetical protein
MYYGHGEAGPGKAREMKGNIIDIVLTYRIMCGIIYI